MASSRSFSTSPNMPAEIVILIGSQVAMKTSFYLERYLHTHVRIAFEQLKTRQREDILVQACLMAKQPFVVDNLNVTRLDRARYITAAKPAGFRVTGYYFSTGQAIGGALELPRLEEGFSALSYVKQDNGQFDVSPWAENYIINLHLTEVEPSDGRGKP